MAKIMTLELFIRVLVVYVYEPRIVENQFFALELFQTFSLIPGSLIIVFFKARGRVATFIFQ